ncbi:hypothetical protein FIV42_02890 [Persicimonas caeni]|uniref:Uncharacterized protein n=1 Tax=Persicimonas caeni TaxID=2292766 RepID=A0A4Y6PN48_PERCE|nr:hypothetical protein [Persicimonas caeni]QDG49722.1 hypothetical protein FIV42_02890 [Persicimonas caeni]QED30943.1 hypothetical protein FRD00_02885 [Persicimonas caeni]
MGETPEVVKIACPGCETQFRLKPKKGRLPEGPVPCPKCAESIPVVEENIRRSDVQKRESDAPQAHVFDTPGASGSQRQRTGTMAGSPVKTPHRLDAVDPDDEFDDLVVSPGLSDSNPKSTFLGMGSALPAINGSSGRRDKTAVVDDELLEKIRSESSVVEDDDDKEKKERRAPSSSDKEHDPLRDTAEREDVFKRKTSENKAIKPEDLIQAEELKEEGEEDDADADKKSKKENKQAPGQMVLGKIKIKKKLKRRSKKPIGARAAKPGETKDDSKKPSLSALLKKARDRKGKLNIPAPKSDDSTGSGTPAEASDDLERALDDLASETARAIRAEAGADSTKTAEPDEKDQTPPPFDTGDSTMIELLRRRVAEDQQPGAASERRGSGYIRLPTAEIQDVLGQGTYRLRVEDIVYEPIDKKGLTQLVKRGVLLGAEEIADFDGDWMPIADHPVFKELRRKMAREAHDLLKQYGGGDSGSTEADDAELPAPQADLPAPQADLPAPQASLPKPTEPNADGSSAELDFSGIPTLEAELEEEAEQAARELFADDEEDAEDMAAPPPMPGPQPQDDAPNLQDEADDGSVQLDYDALGVDEEDVEFEESVPAAETGSHRAAGGGSMRTWLPLLTAAVVLGGIAAFAFSPMGRPYVDNLLGEEASTDDTPKPASTKAVSVEKEEKKESAKVDEAIDEATSSLHAALAVDPNDATLQEQVAGQLADEGEHVRAAKILGVLWQERQDDADFAARYANALLAAGDHARARAIAIDGVQLGENKNAFAKLFAKAIQENPELRAYEVVDVALGEHADGANAESEGKRVVLELTKGDAHSFTFKPSQAGWEEGWRSSIASWRLCQIMACNFEVPHSQPARLDKASFDKLGIEGPASSRLSRLNWVTEDGKQYVYGVLQAAVAEPARFPIEDTDVWRGWLLPGSSAAMDAPATEAISGVENRFQAPLEAQLGDTPLAELAGDLSTVLVFDFLTNNWDRFRGNPDQWGTNLHLVDGSLVSKDNGTAFQPRASTRVKGRFRWTSRFSQDTITSLRLMDPKLVSDKLFPKASAAEKAKLEVFWSQRDEVLERADSLTDVHGAKEVLAFE